MTKQPIGDVTSSGVIAIAYATMLLFDENPQETQLKIDSAKINQTSSLRAHLLPIIESNELQTFPEAKHLVQKSISQLLPAPIVIINDLPEIQIRLDQPAHRQTNMDKIRKQLGGSICLDEITIDLFIGIVNENSIMFKMVSVVETHQFIERLQPRTNSNDVQILFRENEENPEKFGHYICVYFDYLAQEVCVYDSLYYGKLSAKEEKAIQQLYPDTEIIYKFPKSMQTDGTSCAVMSIAYTSLLINGEYLENVRLPNETGTAILRAHLLQISETRNLQPFPQLTEED